MIPPEDDDDLLDEFGLGGEQAPATPDRGRGAGGVLGPGVGALGNGIKWGTVEPGVQISMQVNFVQTGTFNMTLFGKAIGDAPSKPVPLDLDEED